MAKPTFLSSRQVINIMAAALNTSELENFAIVKLNSTAGYITEIRY